MSNSKMKPHLPLAKRPETYVMKLFEEWEELARTEKSQRKASRILAEREDFTPEEVRQKFKRIAKTDGRVNGKRIFTFEEEETILGILQAWSLLNRSLCRQELMLIARSLRPDRQDWDAMSWSVGFLERHKARLACAQLKGLSFERVKPVTLVAVEKFIEWFQQWKRDNKLCGRALLNADETRVTVDINQLCTKLIECKEKEKKSSLVATAGKGATYIPFHSAAGSMIMSVFVVPFDANGFADFQLDEVRCQRRDTHPVYFAFTETGWMNSVTWLATMDILKKEMEIQHPGLRVGLLLDQLKVHLDADSLVYCSSNDIAVGFFPPHCTHFLQPSDDVLFTNFKKSLRRMAATTLHVLREDDKDLGSRLIGIAQSILGTLSPEIIKRSWANTGMFPFEKEKIKERALKNIGNSADGQIKMKDDSRAAAVARQASQDVIDRVFNNSAPKRTRVRAITGLLFSGEEIIQQRAQLAEEAAEKEAEKLRKKEEAAAAKIAKAADRAEKINKFSCKGTCHEGKKPPVWNKGAAWSWCERCKMFGLCTRCKGKDKALIEDHAMLCDA